MGDHDGDARATRLDEELDDDTRANADAAPMLPVKPREGLGFFTKDF